MAYQGRLSDEFLGRFEDFSIRVLRLCMQLARDGRPRPIMDQLMRCGTSPGAQIAEAQEAMSTADFFRSIAIAVKELNETAYWLKLLVGMQWIPGERLHPLRTECRVKLVYPDSPWKTWWHAAEQRVESSALVAP